MQPMNQYTTIVHDLLLKIYDQGQPNVIINLINTMYAYQLRSKNIWDHMLTDGTKNQ